MASESQTLEPPSQKSATTRSAWSLYLAWACLALFLLTSLPLFLCLPLATDTIFYDVCARNLLQGGVAYRDIFQHGAPGMMWLHTGIRYLFGWRSESIRVVDFAVISAGVFLLVQWLKPLGFSAAARVWTALLLFVYYFSTSEWCHCQRDPWQMLPALAALYLRRRQVLGLLQGEASVRRTLLAAAVEGLCWGMAVWIKPHVVVPAFVCWLVGVLQARQAARRLLAADAVGLLAGGLLAGGLGIGWLHATGAWPYFETYFFTWNLEYVADARLHWAWRFPDYVTSNLPWSLLHALAIPTALFVLWRGIARPKEEALLFSRQHQGLLAAFYLGWFLQVMTLQRGFDYITVVPTMLALVVVVAVLPLKKNLLLAAGAVYFVMLAALWPKPISTNQVVMIELHPTLRWERLSCWPRCLTEGATPELRDQLSLFHYTSSVDLQRVADYLKTQGIQDGELTCFSNSTMPLLAELELRPATSLPLVDSVLDGFPSRRPEIWRMVINSSPRFIVTDLEAFGLHGPELHEIYFGADGIHDPPTPATPPGRSWKSFHPMTHPIVFKSGRYVVHRVMKPTAQPPRVND